MQSRNRFTLVELLVALGVFSLLLVVFMQVFTGMRLIWTNTEKRNETVADARVAMDMVSVLLSSVYYSSASSYVGPGDTSGAQVGHFPFRVDVSADKPGRLLFACKTNYDLPGSNPIRFIGIYVPNAEGNDFATAASNSYQLYLAVLSNSRLEHGIIIENSTYFRYFPNFLNSAEKEIPCATALTNLESELPPKGPSGKCFKLMDRVIEFEVKAYNEKGHLLSGSSGKVDCVPHEIELKISVLNELDFETWKGLTGTAKDDFRLNKQMTFTRRIFIGERRNLEVAQ